jgi:hypothetical protein
MSHASSSRFASGASPRRQFLRQAGALAAGSLVLAACGDDAPVVPASDSYEFGAGDAGVMSYLFLLERFSADFYARVLTSPPSDLTTNELALLRDIYRHELVHRELMLLAFADSNLLASGQLPVLQAITFNYTSLATSTREGLLTAARMIEDMGVAALSTATKRLTEPVLLRLVLKMTAVEARHAATVRDLLQPGSFAAPDVVDDAGTNAGLNKRLTPAQVITELNKYSSLRLTGASLPTS